MPDVPRGTSAPYRAEGALRRDDLQVEDSLDLGVQAHRHLVRAERLDRRTDLDPALVDGRTTDVGRGDGAEEAAGVSGAGAQLDLDGLQLTLDRVRVLQRVDLADAAGAADLLDVLLATLGPRDGEAPRDQVVAGAPRPLTSLVRMILDMTVTLP